MSEGKGSQEPSMEEILASIRRIIAEDTSEPAKPDPVSVSVPMMAPIMPKDDILELTELAPEEPPPGPMGQSSIDDLFRMPPPMEPMREEPVFEEEPPPPPPMPERTYREPPPREPPPYDPMEEGIVSAATAAASAAAFASIAGHGRRMLPGDTYLGNGAVTLEEIVRDMLRPLLKDWLDMHLPGITERLVREEIDRIARSTGL